MRVLYISQSGMLEHLGQAQVLPYLRGLSRRGFEYDLLSFELATADRDAISDLRSSLRGDGIRWTPLVRRQDPRLAVKVQESAKGILRAFATALARRPTIVHGRSYFATAIADLVATVVPRARLLFDCRGMLGDEYVDINYWTPDRIEYRMVKRFEQRAFRRAEGVVVLTNALKEWIRGRTWLGPRTHIEAIPCCVDLERFRFDASARVRVREELGLGSRLVLVYSGSLGSFYREADVARFAALVKRRAVGEIRFLLLTGSSPERLVGPLEQAGLTKSEIVVRKVNPSEMYKYLSAGDLGISFITSTFSKKGSSPTKVAEYLACGLPVVLNGDIGDQGELAVERDACAVFEGFSDQRLEAVAEQALALAARPLEDRVAASRRVATTRFDVERVGVSRYERLYRALA